MSYKPGHFAICFSGGTNEAECKILDENLQLNHHKYLHLIHTGYVTNKLALVTEKRLSLIL